MIDDAKSILAGPRAHEVLSETKSKQVTLKRK
jgi:hypothetical protein